MGCVCRTSTTSRWVHRSSTPPSSSASICMPVPIRPPMAATPEASSQRKRPPPDPSCSVKPLSGWSTSEGSWRHLANGRGNVLAGGRYSYTAGLLSIIAPEVATDYRDYQLRLAYDLSPDDRVSLFGFGAYDLVGTKTDNQLDVLFASEFHRIDLRYDRRLGAGSELRIASTVGWTAPD